MYSASRRQVVYHNFETRMVVDNIEAAKVADRMSGTPDPPPDWVKLWDAEAEDVVYTREGTGSRVCSGWDGGRLDASPLMQCPPLYSHTVS